MSRRQHPISKINYNCVKFHKTPISRLEGVSLTRYTTPLFRESISLIISPSKFQTATIFLHAHLQVLYYNCLKFHKTPISRLEGVALTRYTTSSVFSISFHYSTYFSFVFSKSFHFSTCLSSVFSKSFHNSTDISSLLFISFHYSTYFSSIFSKSFHYSTYFSSIISISFHYSTYFSYGQYGRKAS